MHTTLPSTRIGQHMTKVYFDCNKGSALIWVCTSYNGGVRILKWGDRYNHIISGFNTRPYDDYIEVNWI